MQDPRDHASDLWESLKGFTSFSLRRSVGLAAEEGPNSEYLGKLQRKRKKKKGKRKTEREGGSGLDAAVQRHLSYKDQGLNRYLLPYY